MKKNIKYSIILVVVITLISIIVYNAKSVSDLESLPKKYCYSTLVGVLNYAHIIENPEEKAALLDYYNNIEAWVNKGKKRGDLKAQINFKIESLSMIKPVYIVDDSDSLFSKVITLYGDGHNSWRYIEGYAYNKTLHDNPPTDSLLNAYLNTPRARHKLAR